VNCIDSPRSPTPYKGGGLGEATEASKRLLLAEMKNTKAKVVRQAPVAAIDWAQWEAEAAPKPRTFGPELRAKLSAAQRASHARKRQRLAEALANEAPPPAAPILRTVTVTEQIFGTMQPGVWYASPDIARVSGTRYGTCKAVVFTWTREGWLERAQNPEWKPPERVGGRQEPKWIYRLTAKGERRHRIAAALL
jgi:hypothetical protein